MDRKDRAGLGSGVLSKVQPKGKMLTGRLRRDLASAAGN
jgi:hypothetical protein